MAYPTYPTNMLQFPSSQARQPGYNAGTLLEAPGGAQLSVGNGNLDQTGKGLFGENPFVEFFGAPIKQLPTTSPETRTHYDHFEAFSDAPNLFLTEYAIRVLTEQDVFWMREVLPWADGSGMNTLNWWRWTFNNHILNRRPDESVSKLLTSERSSGSEAMVNYGIALEMEYNFFNTAAGRRHYWMQHKQIYLAIMETAAMGCALELLNTEPPTDSTVLTRQPTMNKTEFLAVLKREVQFWNIFTKEENGWKIAIRMASEVLAQRGVKPSYAIFPRGSAGMIQQARPELRQAHISGRPYNDAAEATLSFNGITIRESRPFLRGEKQPPFDPFFQWRTIGGYFPMLASSTKNVPAEDYRHAMRTTWQFSESANDEVPHTLGNALRYSGMIDMNAGDHGESKIARPGVAGKSTLSWESESKNKRIWGLTPLGQSFFKDWATWYDYLVQVDWLGTVVDALRGRSGWVPHKVGAGPAPITLPSGGGGGGLPSPKGSKPKQQPKPAAPTAWKDVFEAFAKEAKTMGEGKWASESTLVPTLADVWQNKKNYITGPDSVAQKTLVPSSVQNSTPLFRIAKTPDGETTLVFDEDESHVRLSSKAAESAPGTDLAAFAANKGTNKADIISRIRSSAPKSWIEAAGMLALVFDNTPETFIVAFNRLIDALRDSYVGDAEEDDGKKVEMDTEDTKGKATVGLHTHRLTPQDAVVSEIFESCRDVLEGIGGADAPTGELQNTLYRILGNLVGAGVPSAETRQQATKVFRLYAVALGHRISELRGQTGSRKRKVAYLDQATQQHLANLADRLRAVAETPGSKVPEDLYDSVDKASRLSSAHDPRALEACVQIWRGTLGTNLVAVDNAIFGKASSKSSRPLGKDTKGAHLNESKFTDAEIEEELSNMRLATHGAWLLQYLYCNNLQVPLSFILWTPHERFLAGSGLLLVPGRELGATFIGTANWQLASDAARKMVYGHFTCSLKSKVLDNKLITRLPNVLVTQYSTGAGHAYWDPLNENDRKRYREHYLADADIFVTAVPADYVYDGEAKDICGRWGNWFNDRATGNPEHYHNSAAYVALWGFAQGSRELQQQYETLERSRHNTVCLPRFCRMYEFTGSVTNSSFSRIIESRGHNGDRVYPGCADARTGAGMYLLPVNKSKRVAAVALQV